MPSDYCTTISCSQKLMLNTDYTKSSTCVMYGKYNRDGEDFGF